MSLPPKPRMNAAQRTLIGYLASGRTAVLVKPTRYTKGHTVTCNGNRSCLRTMESLVHKGVAELVPGASGQWRLTENGRKWFFSDLEKI